MSDDMTLDDIRDRLIVAALDHVPFDGWSDKALRHAAQDCGLDSQAPERAFPHGVSSAVRHFTQLGDRMMIEDLQAIDMDGMSIRDRIVTAVRTRLERWAPHQEAVRRALAVYAMPRNIGAAGPATWHTVDLMWKAIGDQSGDFSWYTKRASLAAVYSATVLYWLDDQSEDFEATWDFLRRRVDDVVKTIKLRKQVTDRMGTLLNPAHLPNPLAMLKEGLAGAAKGPRRPGDFTRRPGMERGPEAEGPQAPDAPDAP